MDLNYLILLLSHNKLNKHLEEVLLELSSQKDNLLNELNSKRDIYVKVTIQIPYDLKELIDLLKNESFENLNITANNFDN